MKIRTSYEKHVVLEEFLEKKTFFGSATSMLQLVISKPRRAASCPKRLLVTTASMPQLSFPSLGTLLPTGLFWTT